MDWKAPINSNVKIFDCATPGTFPILNWNCVRLALRAARNTQCTIAPVILFDRKHYQHWDLPAGYQITQKRLPLGTNGRIDLLNGRTINLKQIHLEQVNTEIIILILILISFYLIDPCQNLLFIRVGLGEIFQFKWKGRCGFEQSWCRSN